MKLTVEFAQKNVVLNVSEISFIKANGRYTDVQTFKNTYLCDKAISTLEEELKPYGLIRVHRSYLINFSLIKSFKQYKDRAFLYLDHPECDHEIPVSRSNISMIKSLLNLS